MDDHRQGQLHRQVELVAERPHLCNARAIPSMEVESNLADRQRIHVTHRVLQVSGHPAVIALGDLRVHAQDDIDVAMSLAQCLGTPPTRGRIGNVDEAADAHGS